MKKQNVKVIVKEGDQPQPVEVIESAITEIAAGMRKLNASRLKRETIVVLLHEASKVGKPHIRYVLNSLDRLEELFLKPKAKEGSLK